MRPFSVDLDPETIDRLAAHGYLDPEDLKDAESLAFALGLILEDLANGVTP